MKRKDNRKTGLTERQIPVCKDLYNNIPSLFGASAPDEGGVLLPESEFIT